MKTALVVGMALSGIASARLLNKDGYRVIINDKKAEVSGLRQQLPEELGYEYRLGGDPINLLAGVDLIVLSPGVPGFLPFIQEAKKRGIETIGEIELGYRYSRGDFYCITGTNGKTTCTALLGEMFKTGGRNTFVLGNIGTPITECAKETREGDIIVAETAALQLEGNVRFHARGASVCNITEDHLDRFLTMENYIAAKCKIFENQTGADVAVLNYDDPIVRDMARLTPARILHFSRKTVPEEGVYCIDGNEVRYRINGEDRLLCYRKEIYIPGDHNLENAMQCAAMALFGGVSPSDIRKTLIEFEGVEHRIEFVCQRGGVRYINDSKGTNPDSTIKAIAAMDRPTVLILGGYDKHSNFDGLFAAFDGRIKGVVVLGDTAPQIIETAKRMGHAGPLVRAERDFEEAVGLARRLAEPGDAVLLSPACASWDMFPNFEERGRTFKRIVLGYPN